MPSTEVDSDRTWEAQFSGMIIEASLIGMEAIRSAHQRAHETGVGRLTAALSQALGCDPGFSEHLAAAATLHDIGKLAIPDAILNKPGKLDAREWHTMRQHTLCGHDILTASRTDFGDLAAEVAMLHHECWDGSGYPKGLKGDAIPRSARIVSLCDCYDAMREVRPYKQPRTHEEVIAIILSNRNHDAFIKFDPEILAVVAAQPEILLEAYKG